MNTLDGVREKQKTTTYMLIINALFIALTFAATWQVGFRLPFIGSGGLIHLGNLPLFLGAFLFGKKTGAIAGSFGMALFDLMSGWTAWAPFTFFIVGAMGYVAGLIAEKKPFEKNTLNYVLAIVVAVIIKVIGYYFAEVMLFGNWVAPFGSIPGNVIQVGVAGILILPIIGKLKKIVK